MKAVILAGGIGTRLWPLSRRSKPKQFQALTSDKTMLEETIDRLQFLKNEDIYIATNKDFLPEVVKLAVDIPIKNIILEPALRDTASCIGFAAMLLSIQSADEVMAVIYADHLVKNPGEFEAKLKVAEEIAQTQNTLNIIEVKARFPNVNLGYVHVGEKTDEINGHEVLAFKGFREKPDIETAKKFANSFEYLWNTGMYVWKIDTILEKYKKHLPDTYDRLMKMKEVVGTSQEDEVVAQQYAKCQKISVDYAIMEKIDPSEVKIIPAEFGWSDVGTWEGVHDELSKDENNNVIAKSHICIDTHESLIRTDVPNKIIAAVGLENIVIVDTKDALLVCKKDKSQDIKKVVQELQDRKEYL